MLNIPSGYYEAAFHHQASGSARDMVCTLGVLYTGSTFAADAAQLADNWASQVMQSVTDNITYWNFTMRDALGAVYSRAESTVGGTAHTPASNNVAFLMQKLTGLGGRKNHGRLYLPGVSEQDVDGVGNVAGSKLTELTTNMGNFFTNIAGFHWFAYLLHNGTAAPSAISSFGFENVAATQRRRMRK